jgi:antitoxin HigA-1
VLAAIRGTGPNRSFAKCEALECGRRGTADTALRLARYFAMTPEFWMNLQAAYDLDVAKRAVADRINRDVHPREAA